MEVLHYFSHLFAYAMADQLALMVTGLVLMILAGVAYSAFLLLAAIFRVLHWLLFLGTPRGRS